MIFCEGTPYSVDSNLDSSSVKLVQKSNFDGNQS